MNMSKIIGYLLILGIISIFVISIVVTLFEIYLNKLDDDTNISLHETNYYGKVLTEDPYKNLIVQHFHPYYVFSLPWKREDLKKVSRNQFVEIDSNGFRSISNINDNKKLLLLGGSTAFGHFSSSNQTTIGSYLNNLTNFDVVNRNAPSWNSHQEATALFKYNNLDDVFASVSLTLGNDVSLHCRGSSHYSDLYHDFPESWNLLADKVNDIRGSVQTESNTRKLKNLINRFFPNVYAFLVQVKINSMTEPTQNQDYNVYGSCSDEEVKIVTQSFLSNQYRMLHISKAYGFKHFLIIQPNFYLHSGSLNKNSYGEKSGNFRKKVIQNIMNSQYCDKNACLDLSSIFDDMGFYLEMYDSIQHNSELVKKWIDSGMFLDEGHFRDEGNEIVANKIHEFINSFNLTYNN